MPKKLSALLMSVGVIAIMAGGLVYATPATKAQTGTEEISAQLCRRCPRYRIRRIRTCPRHAMVRRSVCPRIWNRCPSQLYPYRWNNILPMPMPTCPSILPQLPQPEPLMPDDMDMGDDMDMPDDMDMDDTTDTDMNMDETNSEMSSSY